MIIDIKYFLRIYTTYIQSNVYIYLYLYVHTYIYMCVCICMCMCVWLQALGYIIKYKTFQSHIFVKEQSLIDLGYYFIGDGQFEEFLTPLDLEAIEIRPRPG